MFKTVLIAEIASLFLGLALLVLFAALVGENPLVLFGREFVVLGRALMEPRFAAYVVVFGLYLIELPLLMVLYRGTFVRLLLAILSFALMHVAFYALQFPFPLNGYEELMLIFCTVFGFFWIGASIGGSLLADRFTGPTRG